MTSVSRPVASTALMKSVRVGMVLEGSGSIMAS
jgi:hypothetical protein